MPRTDIKPEEPLDFVKELAAAGWNDNEIGRALGFKQAKDFKAQMKASKPIRAAIKAGRLLCREQILRGSTASGAAEKSLTGPANATKI